MNRVKYFLILSLLAFLFSCQKELDIYLPYEGEKLIIYGLISSDSVISVNIQKTAPPTGVFIYDSGFVKNATVELFEENLIIDTLIHKESGIYSSLSGFKPKEGKGYHLKVTAPGMPVAETSIEVVPSRVKVESYVFKDTLATPFSGETAVKLELTFSDEEKEGELYLAHIMGQYEKNFVYLNTFVAGRPLEASEDLCLFKSEENQYVFNDICFNGKFFTTSLGIALSGALQEAENTDRGVGEEVVCDEILVRFRKMNKSYRDYLRLAGIENEGFFKAFAVPSKEYTNVKGGYGLWAAYSEEVIDVLKK